MINNKNREYSNADEKYVKRYFLYGDPSNDNDLFYNEALTNGVSKDDFLEMFKSANVIVIDDDGIMHTIGMVSIENSGAYVKVVCFGTSEDSQTHAISVAPVTFYTKEHEV